MPQVHSTPLLMGSILKKSGEDKRLDQLESMLETQYERNDDFKDTVMSALSMDQATEPLRSAEQLRNLRSTRTINFTP